MHAMFKGQQEIWHYLIAAELSASKLSKIIQDISAGEQNPVQALLLHPALTASEKRRIQGLDMKKVYASMEKGVELCPLEDLPVGLSQIDFPPAFLYKWGNKCWESKYIKILAIVGTRKLSSAGARVAKWFSSKIAEEEVIIVSGGAYGVDTIAHQSALEKHTPTIVMMATGMDTFQPSSNQELFVNVKDNGGCLLSPFSIGAKWHNSRPLIRNYLIAAIADAVLVIEAPAKSGALVTANAAAAMGKDVYVVPGGIDTDQYAGSNQLIRDGATLVSHPSHVLEDLCVQYGKNNKLSRVQIAPVFENKDHKNIYDLLKKGPKRMDEILENLSHLSAPQIMCMLTEMELEGFIIKEYNSYSLSI